MRNDREYIETVLEAVRVAQTVIDMHFLEHAYGTPSESYVLASLVINHLVNEGFL